MHNAASKKLAFRLLAATASLSVTAAFLAAAAPAVYAAQVGGVQGTVKDTAGKPLQGAQVVLTPIGGGAGLTARTDSSGGYNFAGIEPGNYTLQVNVVTYTSVLQNISVTQDYNATLDVTLTKKTVNTTGRGLIIPLTKTTDTTTEQQITATDEKREKSQPNNLYQSTGLLNYKTGVTTDAGQYPHVRGSDGNQVDWSIDGIDLRDPITNQFATNLVTVGIRSSNVITGGADASYGGSGGAYLNQLSTNGRDLVRNGKTFGGYIENTNGPASIWGYEGGATNLGGTLLNNKLDYALSSIVFKTKYGLNTQLGALNSSHDEAGKFNYYASPNDTFTTYFAHGAENYNSYEPVTQSNFYDPDQKLTSASGTQYTSSRTLSSNFTDHNVQTYNLDHFTYKHNFGPASFLQYRIFQLHQAIPNHLEGTAGAFVFSRTNVTGNQFDYYNQINKANALRAGLSYTDAKGSYDRQVFTGGGPLNTAATGTALSGANIARYTDRTFGATPADFAFYLADQLTTAQNKLVVNYGLRFSSTTFSLKKSNAVVGGTAVSVPGGYTTKATDPRLGIAYTPLQDLTFHSSYTLDSQRPDMRRLQRLGPGDVGDLPTATNAGAAAAENNSAANYGINTFNRLSLSKTTGFDLGVEKGLRNSKGFLAGAYSVSLTGYNKWVNNLAFQTAPNYIRFPAVHVAYDNEGKQHASGFEFSFRKLQRRPSDWSGYVNYTNQVVRTNSSLYDTAYTPYGISYLANSGAFNEGQLQGLARQQFSPSWDQRHTVAVVATKRILKQLESTFILDAGSGLPFFSNASSTNGGTFGTAGGGFAEISNTTGSTLSNFTNVPVILNNGGTLPALNPIAGHTGWHYKISINSDFNITPDFSLFLNVDNIFDKLTPLSLSTATYSGQPFYNAPTAAFPQGTESFKPQSVITPTFLTFGFRQRF